MRPFRALILYSNLILPWSLVWADLPARLLDVDWLEQNLQQSGLRILDVRPAAQYGENHIPGAVNLPFASTFAAPPRENMMASVSQIQRLFSEAGIDSQTDVLLYDAGEFIYAARVLWILEAYGHRHSALLNGGMAAWRAAGFSLQQQAVVAKPSQFLPRIDPDRIATKLSTRLAIESDSSRILDVRDPLEYHGEMTQASRHGHIPGAINIPWNENYITDTQGVSRIKSLPELRQLYADIDPEHEVISYCNRGEHGALTHFILRELGYQVSTYDGSWIEWGNDPELPVVNHAELTRE